MLTLYAHVCTYSCMCPFGGSMVPYSDQHFVLFVGIFHIDAKYAHKQYKMLGDCR